MATVDFKRIDQVYDNLTATLIDTTASSEMPVEEQDSRLAESCRQVCDLLTEWLEGGVWDSLRASVGGPIAAFARDQEQFDRLLPTLQDVLERASGPLIEAVPEYVGKARAALQAAADRDQELFQRAEDKVAALKGEVCKLATQLRNRNATHEQKTNARVSARKKLATVIMLLPPLFMAMAGVTPHQAARNLGQWGQALDVITIQDITVRAELPSLRTIPRGIANEPASGITRVRHPAPEPVAGQTQPSRIPDPTVKKAIARGMGKGSSPAEPKLGKARRPPGSGGGRGTR
jgi:hypothetical protein